MANWVDSGKGLRLRSESKVLGEKRVGVDDLDDKDEGGSRKRIKMRDLESVCRAEGSSKKGFGGKTQLHDEEMSEITEVPVTSELDASRAGKGVRSTFPITVDPLPKPFDLNKDVCVANHKVQTGCQQLFKSSGEATLQRDQVTREPSDSSLDCSQVGTSVKTTIPVLVNPIPKPLDCKTDACTGSSTVQTGNQQCSHSSEKTRVPMDHVTQVPKISSSDTFQTGTAMSGRTPVMVSPMPRQIDLNAESCIISNTVHNGSKKCSQNSEKSTVLQDHDKESHTNPATAKGNLLGLIAKGVSSSENQDPFYPYKNINNLKSIAVSECGSCTGPLEEKDPMTVWKEMKENGFLSSTHGGITKPKQPVVIPMPTPKLKQQPRALPILIQHGDVPTSKQHGGIPIPKPRPRKYKTEEQKKKVERAKKEQVDRFAKLAAPSGLLNELNPGIINHVRNRKQVHSIIQALVRSERVEFSHAENTQTIHQQDELVKNSQDCHNMSESWASWRPNSLFDDMRAQGYTILMNKPSLVQKNIIEGYPTSKERFGGNCFASHSTRGSEDDSLGLKLSSSTIAPEEDSPSSCKEEMTSYLSFKAASVASQWLELIQQDIQERLAALQRSRKRVQNVISTDLPLLLKKEFPFDKEIDFSATKSSVNAFASHALAEMHRARWGPRFDQMDKALLEEKEQLESWLNQVREMQVHCNKGLQLINFGSGTQACGTFENDTRSDKPDSSQRKVAIRAAAASIYATCNFILSSNARPIC